MNEFYTENQINDRKRMVQAHLSEPRVDDGRPLLARLFGQIGRIRGITRGKARRATLGPATRGDGRAAAADPATQSPSP